MIRPRVMGEGVLRDIAIMLLEPLIRHKPPKYGLRAWLEDAFGVRERTIIRYRVLRAFRMPGLLVITRGVKRQGVGPRRIRKDTILWVREDARVPDVVEIEVASGVGRESFVYQLDNIEWTRLGPHLHRLQK